MDIESLKLFLDVRNFGSLTNAANINYIKQSTVGKRISLLEEELGIQLFQRSRGKSRVIITPAGEAFSDIAERMLLLYGQAMELQKDEERRTLTIACINSVQDYSLPPLILQLKQQYPNLCVSLEDHHSVEIFLLLENRRVDIGIAQASAPFSDLQSVLLFEEDYRVVMLPSETERFPTGSIHPHQLPAKHEIFEAFDSNLQNWHDYWWQPFNAKIRVNTTPTAERYFNTPEEWMIVPASVARLMEQKGLLSYTLEKNPPRHHVFAVYEKQMQNPYVELFIEAAKVYYKEYGLRS
jgi:DNA-binding transcriptional LysR family regulator